MFCEESYMIKMQVCLINLHWDINKVCIMAAMINKPCDIRVVVAINTQGLIVV
jgi:hypothetical protein